jgi:poly(3-hydroxybutyrate) depolymerase
VGAAHDVPSAFGAMHGGGTLADGPRPPEAQRRRRQEAKAAMSTIVFHGDNDRTVDVRNGVAIVEQAMAPRTDEPRLQTSMKKDAAPGGRTYSRVVYTDEAGQPYAEHWTLHGAGHAWSGGSPKGSFTDPLGPDASAEMIRFFYSQQRESTG